MQLKPILPLLLILALPLAYAAQVAPAPAETGQAAKAVNSNDASKAQRIEIAAAPADQAQVVFFRSWRVLHSVHSSSSVSEGGESVGTLKNGTYFVRLVAPGSHTYSVEVVHKNDLTIDVAAGKTYYVRENMRIGVLTERPNLERAEASDFEKLSDELTRVD